MFGRGGEEALALKAHGIPVHEVPGVTSGIGLCGMAGIPVTHRGASRGFHVITGHTADNLSPEVEEIRWKSYVKLVGTLSDVAAKVKEVDFPSPAIIVVGEVASLELTD